MMFWTPGRNPKPTERPEPPRMRFDTRPTTDGLVLRLNNDRDEPIPVADWTREDAAGAGVLLRHREDGQARESSDGTALTVQWAAVAAMSPEILRVLGLPEHAPVTLTVGSEHGFSDPAFRIRWRLTRRGRPIAAPVRTGAWLTSGGEDWILPEPTFGILDTIERTNAAEGGDMETRLLAWARIREKLPDDAIDGDRLRRTRFVVASAFEIAPKLNGDGEIDFDPVIGRIEERQRSDDDGRPEDADRSFESALPADDQKRFAERFRALPVNRRYSAGQNTFVVLTPHLEQALSAVKTAQEDAESARRAFMTNPQPYIRRALRIDDDGTDEAALDLVFSDAELSERVKGVGAWTPKVLPWIRQAKDPWLPPDEPDEIGLVVGEDGPPIPVKREDLPELKERLEAAAAAGQERVEWKNGRGVPATEDAIRAVDTLLNRFPPPRKPDRPPPPDGPEDSTDPKPQTVLVIDDNHEELTFKRERRRRRPGIADTGPRLKSTLLPHQDDCLSWLKASWDAGRWGVVLADDMGLGKTLETLAFLDCRRQYEGARGGPAGPTLIVAPTGLLKNWRSEHDRHLAGDGLGRTIEAHGAGMRRIRTTTARARHEMDTEGVPMLDTTALSEADVVLTTYETLRDYQHSFGRVAWRTAVFDEAQKMKNPGTKLTEAALAMNAEFSILMTGTPVENRPSDIWPILDRAEPGLFGPLKQFSRRFEDPAADETVLTDLHRILTTPGAEGPAVMMRRLKGDHLKGLPDKDVRTDRTTMPTVQADAYRQIVEDKATGEPGAMLRTLQRLKSVSLHPAGYTGTTAGEADAYVAQSARLTQAVRILDGIAASGEKALVFVEAIEMQEFLMPYLRRRYQLAADVLLVNGRVSGDARKRRVDAFQNRPGFDVMLLSPRAGGVGLTLTAANHVIHLSRWWNPAVEDQCTDRVFRIGQTRPVHVHVPMAVHPEFGEYSFDLKLDGLLTSKRSRNAAILAPTKWSSDDVKALFEATTTEARRRSSRTTSDERNRIEALDEPDVDLMEPEQFERWTLEQLRKAGYETRPTPKSHDGGADGIAVWRGPGPRHTLIVQCKHRQPDALCDHQAVDDVIRAMETYDVEGPARGMAVTNARGFTRAAREKAAETNVQLVSRHELRTATQGGRGAWTSPVD